MKKTTKIGIIGAGHVGSHVASSLMTQGLCDEIVLLDTDEGKARRHADDIADSVAYMPLPAKIYAGGYEALADADIVVLSACSTIFEQDRLLELDATVKVIAEIAPQLTASGFSGIVVSISNPCDVIAQYFARITGLNVVGTGTALTPPGCADVWRRCWAFRLTASAPMSWASTATAKSRRSAPPLCAASR